MSKLILTVGISNCGKSSWASNYCANNPNTVDISRDHYRYGSFKALRNMFPISQVENQIDLKIKDALLAAVQEGKDVIISDTNLNPRTRKMWIEIANTLQLQAVEFVVFATHFNNTFFGSGSSQVHTLPDHVIDKQYNLFSKFLNEEPARNVDYILV